MIQNQAGAGLAPLGNFCYIAGCPVTSTPSLELFCQRVKSDLLQVLKPTVPLVWN